MPSTRRGLLAALGTGVGVAAAGCLGLPPGPTPDVTLSRTRGLDVPDARPPHQSPGRPQALAQRVRLDRLVTAAEPLLAEFVGSDVPDDRLRRDVRWGVEGSRTFLDESAADPTTREAYAGYRRYVPRAGYALGALRAWAGVADADEFAAERRRARDAIDDAQATFEYRCVDPARCLSLVGWAERHLTFAGVAYPYLDRSDLPPERWDRLDALGRVGEKLAKVRREVSDARYVYRDFREGRPDDATAFLDALRRNRRRLRDEADERAVGAERVETRADELESRPKRAFLYRLARGLEEVQWVFHDAARHRRHGREALSALTAGHRSLRYRAYHDARERATLDELADGPPQEALFWAKRRAVRRIKAGLAGGDPLLEWYLHEASRLAFAGDSAFEGDHFDADGVARAVAYAYYLRAAGYASAASETVETLVRR